MTIELVECLQLTPHPEGGYFRRTFVSEYVTDVPDGQKRQMASAIFYYLKGTDFSTWHRLAVQDEIFHHYAGSSVTIHVIDSKGALTHLNLGIPTVDNPNCLPQQIIRAGSWFAVEVDCSNSFSLMGCTLTPQFTVDDFAMPTAAELLAQFPQHQDIIKRLTRE